MTTHFTRAQLQETALALRESYATADPFPHVVIDDFLPPAIVRDLIAAFPEPTAEWQQYLNERERKFALADEEVMPWPILRTIRELNGQVFIEFLETLTGITGLVADPTLFGGGMHQIGAGGVLKVHADFNLHAHLGMERRINALLYLNEDWPPSFGGDLELWDSAMSQCAKRIPPIANRLVIFSTRSDTFHGHPEPLTPAPGRFRRSLAWYYYTTPSDTLTEHRTVFKARPGERVVTTREKVARQLTPPIVMQAIQRARSLRRGS